MKELPDELLNYIVSGNCVLFLGAGASYEVGAPTAREMAIELSEKFLNKQHKEESLSTIASYIEAKPGLGRRFIIDYLTEHLSSLKPSKAHLMLPKFNWAAIYTTNYDTLIEQAFEKVGVRYKTLISSRDLLNNSNDHSTYVLIYKPHGCISRSTVIETPMVITENDYYSSTENRKAIYRQLEIHRYKKVFLFIGYSFSDFNLSQIWFDILKELGKFSQWAYALWPGCSEIQKIAWQKRNIELIDMRFGDFMKELNSVLSQSYSTNHGYSISNPKYDEITKMLVSVIESRDLDLSNHVVKVKQLSLMIAKEMAIPIEDCQLLEVAALLHDIGFIAIPDAILKKQGALTLPEYELIKQHTLSGEQILSSVSNLRDVANIVRSHHERFDGKGYPDGLTGEMIPQLARILAVADSMERMRSDRPYRKSLILKDALLEIENNSGTQFDPLVVNALKEVCRNNENDNVW